MRAWSLLFNSPPLGNPGPPRARENQNGPKRVRLGGRVNEAALNEKHIINAENSGLSAGTGKLCIFGHLGLVFIWSCFVSCLLLLLYYVICAPVLTEGTENSNILEPP